MTWLAPYAPAQPTGLELIMDDDQKTTVCIKWDPPPPLAAAAAAAGAVINYIITTKTTVGNGRAWRCARHVLQRSSNSRL